MLNAKVLATRVQNHVEKNMEIYICTDAHVCAIIIHVSEGTGRQQASNLSSRYTESLKVLKNDILMEFTHCHFADNTNRKYLLSLSFLQEKQHIQQERFRDNERSRGSFDSLSHKKIEGVLRKHFSSSSFVCGLKCGYAARRGWMRVRLSREQNKDQTRLGHRQTENPDKVIYSNLITLPPKSRES